MKSLLAFLMIISLLSAADSVAGATRVLKTSPSLYELPAVSVEQASVPSPLLGVILQVKGIAL